MGSVVVKTCGFIRHMVNQTESGCWNVKYVDISFQKESTQLYQRDVFPGRRSSPYFIIWVKAVANEGFAGWWE